MPSWIWIQNVVFPLIGMGMGTFAMYAIYRTVNRHLDRRHDLRMAEGGAGPVADEVERLHQRMEVIEDQVSRVAELEERLEFAERLLAQQSDRQVLRGDN